MTEEPALLLLERKGGQDGGASGCSDNEVSLPLLSLLHSLPGGFRDFCSASPFSFDSNAVLAHAQELAVVALEMGHEGGIGAGGDA